MKSSIALLGLFSSNAVAFVVTKPIFQSNVQLKAEFHALPVWVATGFAGMTFVANVASAAPSYETLAVPDLMQHRFPTSVIAGGAYIPEEGYGTLDLAMPSYRVDAMESLKTPGFSELSNQITPIPGSATQPTTLRPNMAEKGAMAVAQAKAKKNAAKAEIVAKQKVMKEQSFSLKD